MKKALLIFTISILAMMIGKFAIADQRCDMDTQNCHISLDANDDDTEMDVPAAMFNAQVNRYVEDGTRKANGSYHGLITLPIGDASVKPPLLVTSSDGDIFTKGNANTRDIDDKFITAQNTACNLVRSNFQENTGSDDQNQTQYTSNDWDLSVTWQGFEDSDDNDGRDRGRGSLDDDDVEYGVWFVAMNCRGGIAQ